MAAEEFEQLGKSRVARRRGDGAMEGEVLLDRAFAARDGGLDGAQGRRSATERSGVMRSAASAAASTSIARRSSITSSTSSIELRPSRVDAEGNAAGVGGDKGARALARHAPGRRPAARPPPRARRCG